MTDSLYDFRKVNLKSLAEIMGELGNQVQEWFKRDFCAILEIGNEGIGYVIGMVNDLWQAVAVWLNMFAESREMGG